MLTKLEVLLSHRMVNAIKHIHLLFILFLPFHLGVAQKSVLICYYSDSGKTEQMALAVERGAKSVAGIEVKLKAISATTSQDVISADAIIIGSPVYNANVSPEVLQFIKSWPFENQPLRDKLGAAFVTAGGMSAGEELATVSLLHSMMIFGMLTVGGDSWTSAFGASAVSSEAPFDTATLHTSFLVKGEALGRRVAQLTLRMR